MGKGNGKGDDDGAFGPKIEEKIYGLKQMARLGSASVWL